MLNKITMEELVELRNTLNKISEMGDSVEEIATEYVDGIGNVPVDYTAKVDRKMIIKDIVNRIKGSEIITDRNFDRISIGTAFYGRFLKDDKGQYGELGRYIIVNSNDYNNNPEFLSKNSPLGKAVLGKQDNDIIIYDVVDENGNSNSLVFYIDSIDRDYNNYIGNINSQGRAK